MLGRLPGWMLVPHFPDCISHSPGRQIQVPWLEGVSLRPSLHLKPRNMREEESDNHQSHSSSPSGSNECLYKVSRPSVQPLLRYFDLTDAGVPKAEPQARLITSFRPHNFFACNVIALLCTISFSSSEFRLYKVWRRSKQQ